MPLPTRSDSGLPKAPTNFAPYDDWVALAWRHLVDSVETAIDELQRDRDFVDPVEVEAPVFSPQGATRDECIGEAVRRLLATLQDAQEG